MEDSSIKTIVISGEVDSKDAKQAANQLSESLPENISVRVEQTRQTEEFWELAISIVSLIVSLISLLLALREKILKGDIRNASALRGAIDNLMIERGITEWTIEKVQNFEALVNRKHRGECCVVLVKSSKIKNRLFKIYAFSDGNVFTLDIGNSEKTS